MYMSMKTHVLKKINLSLSYYTPGIYADGYIVFAFPFVCSLVGWLVRSLVRSLFRNVRGIYVNFSGGVYLMS